MIGESQTSVGSAVEREAARLQALERYDVLGTPAEASFDRITRLAQRLFHVPVAIVSFIDGHRQSYKSCQGLSATEVPKETTFCQHVIASGRSMIVPDTAVDPRFQKHPFVVNDPFVRFYAGIPLKTSDGHSIGVFCILDWVPRPVTSDDVGVMEDLAAMAMGALELRASANKDSLTGLLARRAFKHEVKHAVALALRHHHDLSLIAFDLDHFKDVNDQHRFEAGEVVLSRTIATCHKALRSTDIMGRLGGEEFAVILPHTRQDSAMLVAEKMRAAVERQRVPWWGKIIKVTASFGIACLDYATRDADALLERADQALLEAKAAGRNLCAAASGNAPNIGNNRRRVLKAGQILFNGRCSTMNCTVRSQSSEGAGLDVSNSSGVPSTFDLVIRSDNFDKACRVVSRTERHIDVRFS